VWCVCDVPCESAKRGAFVTYIVSTGKCGACVKYLVSTGKCGACMTYLVSRLSVVRL
jgi:hypothetical protein